MQDPTRYVPLFSAIILVPAIARLGAVGRCAGACRSVELAALALYLGWLVTEVAVASVREIGLPPAPEDRGTFQRYGLAQVATALSAAGLAHAWPLPWHFEDISVGVIGALFVALGGSLRLWAMFVLGRWYSRRVRVLVGHRVVSEGPYRVVRHPAYLGAWLGHVGLGLAFQSPASLALAVLALLPSIVGRIRREDAVLLRDLPGYLEYAAGKKRLLPGIW